MNKIDINKKLIIDRIDIIQKSVERLKKMRKMSQGKFALEDNFAIAEHNLRRALEAVFDIGSHILSRIPHVQVSAYKEIAQKLHLSTYTVKSHVHNILEKLSLNTRVQIAKYAHISDSYKVTKDAPPLINK